MRKEKNMPLSYSLILRQHCKLEAKDGKNLGRYFNRDIFLIM